MERILHRTSVGVTAKACQINGLNLTDVTYPPDLRQARHTHRFASFSLVKSGNYLETFNRQSFARRASTVVFHPPEESHAVNFETNVQILSVQFDFRRLAAIREHCAIFDEPASFRNENINHLGRRIYRELQRPDAFSSLAIEGLILEILAEASRCKTHGEEKKLPPWLSQTKDFLHDNFADSLAIEDIAAIAGVHPVHLSRVFRQNFGCTIGEYVRRLRADFAKQQIGATEAPLSEIALAAGFADQSHLSRTFKSIFGLTPAAHRKNSRRR